MSVPAFDIGDQLRLGNSVGSNPDETVREPFTTVDGVVADPTTVTLELRRPDGTELTYAWPTGGDALLVRESAGRFYRDLTIDTSGRWCWVLTGTGVIQTSEQGQFYARRRACD